MKAKTAAIAAFFTLAATAHADELREMSAVGNGAEFVITNQPCAIDFHEPTNFKYSAYVITDDHTYEACWYGNDGAIWMAVDEVRQIVSLDPNAFHIRENKAFKGPM
jgi:L-aminopeptidase/D-esterase-like protein